MLRAFVLGCGALLAAAGVVIGLTCHTWAWLGPGGFGIIVVLATLFERLRYKKIMDRAPGPDWQPTGERFLDPNSDVPVEVYFQPATGKRVYVRAGYSA